MVVTTSESVPGKKVAQVLGIVSSTRLAWFSAKNTQEKLIEDLQKQAATLGGNAVVGLKISSDLLQNFTAYGTAVKLESV